MHFWIERRYSWWQSADIECASGGWWCTIWLSLIWCAFSNWKVQSVCAILWCWRSQHQHQQHQQALLGTAIFTFKVWQMTLSTTYAVIDQAIAAAAVALWLQNYSWSTVDYARTSNKNSRSKRIKKEVKNVAKTGHHHRRLHRRRRQSPIKQTSHRGAWTVLHNLNGQSNLFCNGGGVIPETAG